MFTGCIYAIRGWFKRWTSNREETEHRTSNVQRWTSNNDVASLRNLISIGYYFCFFIFFLIQNSMLMTLRFIYFKTSEPQNIECRTAECRRKESLCSVFFKIDRSTQRLTAGRIHYFDIRHSLFDLPAMPWYRCEVNLTIWFINQWLHQPNALCMAGGYSLF
jgi:hypothetical protein